MFLSDAELFQLTGRRRPKAQANWLRSRRIRHYINAAGKVVVRTAWLDGSSASSPQREPDFAAMPR